MTPHPSGLNANETQYRTQYNANGESTCRPISRALATASPVGIRRIRGRQTRTATATVTAQGLFLLMVDQSMARVPKNEPPGTRLPDGLAYPGHERPDLNRGRRIPKTQAAPKDGSVLRLRRNVGDLKKGYQKRKPPRRTAPSVPPKRHGRYGEGYQMAERVGIEPTHDYRRDGVANRCLTTRPSLQRNSRVCRLFTRITRL